MVNKLTKIRYFVPCKKLGVENVIDAFLKHIFPLHSIPLKILSNRGSAFIATFWGILSKQLGCTLTHTNSWHPKTNSQTKRLNSTISQFLRCFVNKKQNNWVDWLPLAEFTTNNHISSTTKISPFFANYRYNPRIGIEPAKPTLPSSLANKNNPSHTRSRKDYKATNIFINNLRKIIKKLHYTLKKAQNRYRNIANKTRKDTPAY